MPMITSDNYEVLDCVEGNGTRYEVLAFKSILGNSDPVYAERLHYMREVGMQYQQVRVCLQTKTSVRMEAGALHFMRGPIALDTDMGNLGKFFRRGLAALASGEAIIKPVYSGTGEIFLEPSFGHYLLVRLDDDKLICDDGMFVACDESVEVSAHRNKTTSSLFGGEGWVQPKLSGTGAVVLKCAAPFEELVRVQLQDDVLKVDGPFAVARLGDIEFSVEKSTRSFLGSAASGEGLLQTFRGSGEVWLNPTQGLHQGPKAG